MKALSIDKMEIVQGGRNDEFCGFSLMAAAGSAALIHPAVGLLVLGIHVAKCTDL